MYMEVKPFVNIRKTPWCYSRSLQATAINEYSIELSSLNVGNDKIQKV